MNPELIGFDPPKAELVGFNALPAPLQQPTENTNLSRGYIAQSNLEDYMAGNQSGLGLLGKAVAQSVSNALLGTVETSSYLLDFEQMVDKLKGDEQEYTNWLAESMQKAKEDINNSSALKVFQTNEAQTGFAPGDATWWAKHSPEAVGSILSLLIPAAGVAGAAAKGAQMLGASAKGINLTRGLSATVASRYAESTMEANNMYKRAYTDLLAQGIDEQTAKIRAGEQASKVWNTNWLFAVQDFFQYSTLLKGANSLAKGSFGKSIGEILKQTVSEAGEEAGQYVVGEEAYKAALDTNVDYFGEGFHRRLSDYIRDPEFKASTLLGAFGGGVFTALGAVAEPSTKAGEYLVNQAKSIFQKGIQKERANYIGDTANSQAISDEVFAAKAFEKLKDGKLPQFKQELEELSHTPDLDNEARTSIKNYIDDIDFLVSEEAKLKNSNLPSDLHNHIMATKLEQRNLARLDNMLTKEIGNIEQEVLKDKELPTELVDVKKLQVALEAAKIFAKSNPAFQPKVEQLQAQFNEATSNPMMKLALSSLVTSKDQDWFNKSSQLMAVNEKMARVKQDLADTTTTEGLNKLKQELVQKKVNEESKAVLNNPDATEEELLQAATNTNDEGLKTELAKKYQEKINAVSQGNQQESADIANQAFVEPDLSNIDPYNIDPSQYELDPEAQFDPSQFDPSQTIITEEFGGGMTYNEVQNLYGKEKADEFLARLNAEQPPEVKEQKPVVTESDLEAKTRLKELKTVPAWSKFYKGSWINDKFVPELVNGVPVPQMYFDSVTNQSVLATDVFEIDQYGHDISSTPLVKSGDYVIAKVVDNGTDKQFRYVLTPGFRPDKQDNYVINLYRANEKGEQLSDKPFGQLPSGDNKAQTSTELTELRNRIINAPNQTLVTNIVSKNIGDTRKSPVMNTIDILEFDYHLTDKGNWVYGKTSHNPIFALADVNNRLIAPNVQNMNGVTPQVFEAVEAAINMPKPKGNVRGGVFTLRMNPEGNFRPVLVYPRNLNTTEVQWLKDNLAQKLADREIATLNQVYFIPETGASILYTSKKMGAITRADRTRFHIAKFTEDNTEFLIPVLGKDGEKMWIAIQASGKNPQVANFLNRQPFEFSWVNGNGTKEQARHSSEQAKPEAIEKIYNAFDTVLNHKSSSRRNITKNNLNTNGLYTDPVTNKQYDQYYDFLKESIETDLPGSKTKGYGEDSSYSYSNARVRINPNPTPTKFIVDEKDNTIVKGIDTTEQKPVPDIEAKKSDIERRRQEELDKLNVSVNKDLKIAETFSDKIPQAPTKLKLNQGLSDKQVAIKTANERLEFLTKEINAKYDAEIAALEQTTALPTTKPIDIEKALRERFSKFRLKTKDGFSVMTEKEFLWFKETFGEDALSIAKNVDSIIAKQGIEAFGLYHDALVTVAQFAETGTLYHEAFHFVFDPQLGLIPFNQREKILDDASKLYGIQRSYDKTKPTTPKLRAVDYALRAVDILKSPKADEIFRKGDKNNWSLDKILQELQIPKEQQELIKSFNTRNREEILTSLLANYSYTIEINTAKSNLKEGLDRAAVSREDYENFKLDNSTYKFEFIEFEVGEDEEPSGTNEFTKDGKNISEKEYEDAFEQYKRNKFNIHNSEYYSNLTVPGGTNYTENEIATPDITPSIKGHAQFATDKGIGWFRSDEQALGTQEREKLIKEGHDYLAGATGKDIIPTKTRRILEVQSDLFQKGRDNKILTKDQLVSDTSSFKRFTINGIAYSTETYTTSDGVHGRTYSRIVNGTRSDITKEQYEFAEKDFDKDRVELSNNNKFLQLLNKDNNWVTFFVKSIIQDSAKKGYEKVLFPSGNTASKVEGHTTLEEFKKQKEKRIQELEIQIEEQRDLRDEVGTGQLKHSNPEAFIANKNNQIQYRQEEINQLKQELERVEREGFGALKPIYKFYENTVTNILKKNYKVNKVTDEYGNTWNEINLTEGEKNTIKLRSNKQEAYKDLTGDEQLEEKLAEDFRAYMLSGGKQLPKVAKAEGFFKKLWNAIKKLVGLKSPIQKLFEDVANKPLDEEQRRFADLVREYGNTDEKYRLLPGFTNYRHQTEAIQATAYAVLKLAKEHADSKGLEILDVLKKKESLDTYFNTVREEFHKDAQDIGKGLFSKGLEEQLKYATYKAMGVVVNPSFPGQQGIWDDTSTELQVEEGFRSLVLKEFKKFGFQVVGKDITNYQNDKLDATDEYTQEEIEDLKQEDEAERVYDQDHTLRNPNNTLGLRLKFFLSTIEDPNATSTILGTPKYINFTRVMSVLKARLANSKNPLTKLEQLAKNDPVSKAVFEALSKEVQNGNIKLLNEFNTGLDLALHNFKTLLIEYDENVKTIVPKFIDTDRGSLNKAIKNKWREEAVRKKLLETDGKVFTAKAGKVLDELNTFKNEFYSAKSKKANLPYEQVKDKFVAITKQVGIDVPEQVWKDEALNRYKYTDLEKWFFGERSSSLENFLTTANSGIDPFSGTKGIADILASRAKNYSEDIKGDTFMNEFNDQVNPINLPSYLTDLLDQAHDKEAGLRLKNYFTQDKFYEKNKFIELFGNENELDLDFISAFRANENSTKDFGSRTAGDSLLARLIAFYNSGSPNKGSIFVGTFSDKGKQAAISLPKKKEQGAYDFLFEVLRNTMYSEIYRIQRIKNNPGYAFPENYRTKGVQFLYIPGLNNIPNLTGKLLTGDLKSTEAIQAKTEADQVIKDFISNQYDQFKSYLVEKGVIEIDEKGNYSRGALPESILQGKTLDSFLKDFFYNDFGWRLEMSKVFNGDIALYKNYDDYYKRGYQAVTPGIVPYNDPEASQSFVRGIYPKQMIKSPIYGDVNKTDAQSYINTSTYRRLASQWGAWTKEMEELFQFAWKDGKTINQAIKEKGVDRETGDRFKKLVNEVSIQVLKPFQFNDREITMPDGSKLLIKEQFKDSMMWLNPELTNRHTELKKLNQYMVDNKIDVMSAEDTTKVGLYGVITDFTKAPEFNQTRVVSFSDIRFPQMMPDKVKEEITGTQFWKLITGNLDPKDERITELNKLWEQKIANSSNELKESLGLGEDWQLSNDKKKRGEQLFKIKTLLQNELASRNLNDNYEDAIQIVLDELNKPNFNIHLGFPMFGRKFLSILTNLFKKNVLQQKSTGVAMVNFADFGVESAETSSNLTLVQNKDGSVEAEIGLPIDFFRDMGLNFKDDVDLTTNKIKWEKLKEAQKEALQFIIYRIPTSNKSSMIPARVVMVLPQSSGNVVMLPGELTIQQGLDFDVDKSQLISRVQDKGKIDKQALDTKLFDIAWSILTDPKNIDEVLTPLDFNTIEEIAKDYEKRGIISSVPKAHFLSTSTDVDMEIRNKHGKKMIGIDSRANTAHAIMQNIPEYVIVKEEAAYKKYNKLGQKLDSKGTLISKNFGELQQSSLDNAKKPIKALLNVFPVTDPVVLYLTALGVPLKETFDFINTPSIREWVKHYDLTGGSSSDKATKSLLEEKPELKNDKDLDDFLRLQKVAAVYIKATNVLSVDTFSDMTGIEPIEAFMNQKDEITHPDSFIRIDPSVFDLNKAPKEAKRLAAFYKYGLENAINFTAQFYPYTSQAYTNSKEHFAQVQGQSKLTDKETIKKLNTFLDYYTLESSGKIAKVLNELSPNYRDRWSFLSQDKSIWNYIDSVIKSTPNLANNSFVKGLVLEKSRKDGVQMIGVVNTSSNVDKAEMTKGWYDLFMHPDEKVRVLAGDLVRFALTTSGLNYNTRSFIDLVPADIWKKTGLVDEHKTLLEGLKSSLTQIDVEGAVRSFIRHEFGNLNEVPEAYYTVSKKGTKTTLANVEADGTHVKSFKLRKEDPLANSPRRFDIPTFLKIFDNEANKYRLYEGSPNDKYFFKEVQPLGEQRAFWEVMNNPDGRGKSIHPLNKESGSPAPFDKPSNFKTYPLFSDSIVGQNEYIRKYIPGGRINTIGAIDILLENEVDKKGLEILNVLKRNASKVNIPVETKVLPKNIPGVIVVDSKGNGNIFIDPNKTISESKLRHVIAHELNHAYSIAVLQNPITQEEVNFARNINRIKNEYLSGKNTYAFTNDYEFLAELGSNPEFRKDLKKKGFWPRILRFFRKLLKFKDKEAEEIDKLLDQYYSVLDNATALNEYAPAILNLEEKQEKAKGKKRIDILQEMLSTLDSRIARLKRQGKKEHEDTEVKRDRLADLVSSNRSQAMVRYMLDTQEEMQALKDAYYKMEKDPAKINPDTIQSMLEQLVSYQLLDNFSSTVHKNPLEFAPDEQSAENLLKNIDAIRADVRIFEEKIKDLRLNRYAHIVYNTSKDPSKNLDKIKDELEVASRDITVFNHLTGIGTDQRDSIISTNHQLMSKAYAEADRLTQQDLYKKDKTLTGVSFEYLMPNSSGVGMHYKKWKGSYNKTGIDVVLNDYEKWLKEQGINPNSIRDKFKPILDSSSFEVGSDGVKFISPASTEGRAILSRKEGDPLRAFYENIVLGYLHTQEKLPRFLRPGLRVPSIQRSLLEGVLVEQGTNKIKALSEAALSTIRKRFDESDRKSVDEAGNPIKGLPVRYISKQDGQDGRLNLSEVSLDVATTVGIFMNEAHLRDQLDSVISDLELGKGIAADREVVKANKRLDIPGIGGWLTSERDAVTLSSGKLETIKGENSEAYKKVVQDLEMLAYGEYKKDEGDFKLGKNKFDIGKTTDTFLKATGFNLLFGRLAIPLTNLMVGKITQLKEAVGGNIIDLKDLAAGEKFFATEAIAAIGDLGLRVKKTQFGRFFSYLNPLDNERPIGDLGVSTNYTRTIFEKIVRSGGSSTEFYLGSTALGAVLNKEEFKAVNSEGKKETLFEAIEFTESGKATLKKGYKYKGKSDISSEDLNEIRNYTIRLYQVMNGVYNKIDAGNSQQYSLGRAVMFMRRWLPEGIRTRWRTRYFDPRLTKENEGHYVSALVALNNIFTRDGWLKNTIDGLRVMTWMGVTNDELLLHPNELNLSQDQKDAIISMRKANVRKTLFELYTIAAFSLLLAFGWDEDDDDSYTKYMVARINRELKTFLSPSTAWDVLRSPTVAMSTIQGISKIIGDTGEAGYSIITGEELPKYEQGDYKGQYKITADVKRQFGLGWIEQFDNLDTKSSLIQRGFR